jgi:hypothetical protein
MWKRHISHSASTILCVIAVAAVLVVGWDARPSARQQTSDGPDVVQIRPNFYVIAGAGGNVVVQIGPEGVILVDSGSTGAADEVLAAIRRQRQARQGRTQHPPGRCRGRRGAERRPGLQLGQGQRAGA